MRLGSSEWWLHLKAKKRDFLSSILDAVQSGRLLDTQSQNEATDEIREFFDDIEGEHSWLKRLSTQLEELETDPKLREYVAQKWHEYRQTYSQ